MFARFACWAQLALVIGCAALGLSLGCATPAAPPTTSNSDMGGSGICPAHPEMCAGKCCGSVCVDISLDFRNCGDCGVACPTGQVCSASRCGCPPTGAVCGMGQSCCGAVGCKSLDSDINNCGACGTACPGTGATCAAGQCLCGGVACPAGQQCCDGVCAASCATAPPDMAMSSSSNCTCSSTCPLSGLCLAKNCCYEDVILGSSCGPSVPPTCSPYTYP